MDDIKASAKADSESQIYVCEDCLQQEYRLTPAGRTELAAGPLAWNNSYRITLFYYTLQNSGAEQSGDALYERLRADNPHTSLLQFASALTSLTADHGKNLASALRRGHLEKNDG